MSTKIFIKHSWRNALHGVYGKDVKVQWNKFLLIAFIGLYLVFSKDAFINSQKDSIRRKVEIFLKNVSYKQIQ